MTMNKGVFKVGQYSHKKGSLHPQRYSSVLVFMLIVLTTASLVFVSSASSQVSSSNKNQPMNLISHNEVTSSTLENQFSLDVAYAYVGKGSSETHFDLGMLMHPLSQYPSIIYFNTTHLADAKAITCDIQLEVYIIQISTDKGTNENYTYVEGTNYKLSNPDTNLLTAITEHVNDLVDLNYINKRCGHFKFNWTTNESLTGGFAGTLGSYTTKQSSEGLWSAGEPETVSITVRRIGWIIADGDTVSVFANTAKTENIVQIQLNKFEDGFMYNKIVPQDKLMQINPLNPPMN